MRHIRHLLKQSPRTKPDNHHNIFHNICSKEIPQQHPKTPGRPMEMARTAIRREKRQPVGMECKRKRERAKLGKPRKTNIHHHIHTTAVRVRQATIFDTSQCVELPEHVLQRATSHHHRLESIRNQRQRNLQPNSKNSVRERRRVRDFLRL